MRFILPLILAAMPLSLHAQETAPDRPAVKLMQLEIDDGGISRRFFGRVTARSTVDLAFQAGGQVDSLPIAEGEVVPEGALLAQLDLDPFERKVAQARAELDQANRELARREQLGPDVTSQAQIDSTRTNAELAQVAYDDAVAALDDATLHAPFDSLLASRYAEQYATVGAGEPIVRIHDMSELRVHIEVPEVIISYVGTNPQIEASADLVGSDEPLPLQYREFTAEASDVGQTYELSLAFIGEVPESLLPGASATVTMTLTDPDATQRILVPPTALQYSADGTAQVLVYEPDDDGMTGTLRAQPVEIEPAENGYFELAAGPEAGTEIVAAGASRLADGDAVRRYTGLGPSGDEQ
ncbi:efflux RND transporter periplasmic adaptor subunit [Pelagovum pacificum]|nr:efflux RND transporter periplasmic adaptor subunit [Pelagovum pacificum]QQA43892.1 efflux RND transporter periplasmic adaptor subunit [Pelagovum pacificum]